ncbi:MAG: hypothetical protein ACP5N3_01370 [Candidatus Nanoarchaeia archaeon]
MKKLFGKRGQAALEFLTTYGWAFMVILVMIGALAYFGVLNPQNLIPDQCAVTSGFTCADFQVGNASMKFLIINNMGEPITVNTVAVTRNSVSVVNACTVPAGNINDGEQATMNCTTNFASLGKPVGSKVKLGYSFNYVKTSGSFNHTATGTITATVASN